MHFIGIRIWVLAICHRQQQCGEIFVENQFINFMQNKNYHFKRIFLKYNIKHKYKNEWINYSTPDWGRKNAAKDLLISTTKVQTDFHYCAKSIQTNVGDKFPAKQNFQNSNADFYDLEFFEFMIIFIRKLPKTNLRIYHV